MAELKLSERQRQVMQYLIDGLTLKEIAEALGISMGTISKYTQRARQKTGARSLYRAIAILLAAGLLTAPALDTPAIPRPTGGTNQETEP